MANGMNVLPFSSFDFNRSLHRCCCCWRVQYSGSATVTAFPFCMSACVCVCRCTRARLHNFAFYAKKFTMATTHQTTATTRTHPSRNIFIYLLCIATHSHETQLNQRCTHTNSHTTMRSVAVFCMGQTIKCIYFVAIPSVPTLSQTR